MLYFCLGDGLQRKEIMSLSDAEKKALKGQNPDGTLMSGKQQGESSQKLTQKSKDFTRDQVARGEKSTPEKLGSTNPRDQQEASQELNRSRESMTDRQRAEAGGLPKHEVYDPGDSDGDNKAVSPSDGNLTGGDPKRPEDTDQFEATKKAWAHLTDVFGEKVSALQSELEGRLDDALTPTDRETGNPYSADDVPESKEMTLDDVKSTLESTKNDGKAVLEGLGDIGGAAASLAGTAAKDTGKAIVNDLGIDTEQVGRDLKTLGGISSLFSSNGNDSKVPDGNWKPASISDLFKNN